MIYSFNLEQYNWIIATQDRYNTSYLSAPGNTFSSLISICTFEKYPEQTTAPAQELFTFKTHLNYFIPVMNYAKLTRKRLVRELFLRKLYQKPDQGNKDQIKLYIKNIYLKMLLNTLFGNLNKLFYLVKEKAEESLFTLGTSTKPTISLIIWWKVQWSIQKNIFKYIEHNTEVIVQGLFSDTERNHCQADGHSMLLQEKNDYEHI